MPTPTFPIASALAFQLPCETEVSLLAANDPVFGELVADDYKGYFRFRIATAFPNVIGPEMHGRYFGMHPQVLANSYRSLLHQQTNLGHSLKAYGGYRDRIMGAIVGVQVGNLQRQMKQTIAATVAAAQYLDVIAVVHKQAEGVKDLLGNHASARQKTSVSIEAAPTVGELSVYDPRDASILSMEVATGLYPKLITVSKEKGLQIGKVDGVQFALAPGGTDGRVAFRGVGYTPNPAENPNTAKIIDLKAAEGSEEILFAAIAFSDWQPGMEVTWDAPLSGMVGAGTIVDVIPSGSLTRHGMTKTATPADPLLDIKVHGRKLTVMRHSSSVKRKC